MTMVWNLLIVLLAMATILLTVFAVVYYIFPVFLVRAGLRYYMYKSGMQIKFVGDEEFVFSYGERGTKQENKSTIMFIHGYTSSKDQWLTLFRGLPQDLHLVALDLPGHGNTSTPQDGEDVSFPTLIEYMHKFVCLVGLDQQPFHLVGTSLGGLIGGLYAASYPQHVEKLSLICPAVKTPVDSKYSREIDHVIHQKQDDIKVMQCSLVPQTPEQTQEMFDSTLYHCRPINKQIMKGIVAMRAPKNTFFIRLFCTLASTENLTILVDMAPGITSPTQLIWGEYDNVIDKSGAEILKNVLPQCDGVDIIDRCGHSVVLDRPGALMKSILAFRGEHNRKCV